MQIRDVVNWEVDGMHRVVIGNGCVVDFDDGFVEIAPLDESKGTAHIKFDNIAEITRLRDLLDEIIACR